MEDQMANDTIKVKLEIDRNVMMVGSRVGLKAILAKESGGPLTDDEIRSRQINVKFEASDGDIDEGSRDGAVWPATYRHRDYIGGSHFRDVKITATALEGEEPRGADSGELKVLDRLRLSITGVTPGTTVEGGLVRLETAVETDQQPRESLTSQNLVNANIRVAWTPRAVSPEDTDILKATFDTTGLAMGRYDLKATLVDQDGDMLPGDIQLISDTSTVDVVLRPLSRGDVLPVALQRTTANNTRDKILWSLTRERTGALSFMGGGYKQFIDKVLCDPDDPNLDINTQTRRRFNRGVKDLGTNNYGMAAYELLKTATEVYLLIECGVPLDKSFNRPGFDPESETSRIGEHLTVAELKRRLHQYFVSGRLPYLERVVDAVFPDGDGHAKSIFCPGALSSRVNSPCMLELIWSYWHEEGMLVQSMNAISRRFQNVRGPGDRDPLAHLEIDPLRPLNNLLWGYIQDEQNLLTVKRRTYEYDHHYGLRLHGKAVPPLRPADSRSKFLEGFHNLLHAASVFYKEDNDTTVIADGFPLLNALREVHLVLAQGAHNQFGDLPWTARSEMLIQQWLLSQPQMREFLQSRPMVPYKEPWMAQVDTMKTLQGWSDITVTHFRDLGTYGEQILLTVRYGDWIDVNEEDSAKNWARYWRPEIQSYIHAYRIVTGVDLTNPETVDYTLPALLLQKRLTLQRTR